MGRAAALIARLKPWAALANITVTPEDHEGTTLDQKLFELARARRLRIEALEGTEEHIAVFDGIPLATQIAMLRHTLEQRASRTWRGTTRSSSGIWSTIAAS